MRYVFDEDFDLSSWLEGFLERCTTSTGENIFQQMQGREECRESYPRSEMCRAKCQKWGLEERALVGEALTGMGLMRDMVLEARDRSLLGQDPSRRAEASLTRLTDC